ncbi:MAG: hypothetical protein ACKE51_07670 [Methylococcaceae bacterium]
MPSASPIDQEKIRDQIKALYEVSRIPPTSLLVINDKVAKIFLQILLEVQNCTKKFVLVPLPTYGTPSVLWLANNIKRSVIENLSSEVSLTCLKGVLYVHSTHLKMATR